MDRRNIIVALFGSALGALGIKKASAAEEPNTKSDNAQKGFIVHYQNVGHLPPSKAEAFCERIADQLRKKRDKEFPGWAYILVPVRPPQETHIEIHGIQGNYVDLIEPLRYEESQVQIMVEDTPQLRAQTKDYVLLMLGAPATPVEIEDSYFSQICDCVYRRMNEASVYANPHSHYCRTIQCFQDGVLAFATKYHAYKNTIPVERKAVVRESKKMLHAWNSRMDDGATLS